MFYKNTFKTLWATCTLVLLSAEFAPAWAECTSEKATCADLDGRVKRLEDKAITSSNMKVTFEGWVNRAVQWADNGFHSNVSHTSPSNVTSNITVKGMIDPVPGFTLGTEVQIDFNANGTTGSTGNNTLVDVRRAQSGAQSEASFSNRIAEITADSKTFGKLSLGRGYMASTGVIYYTDLSGTYFFLHPYSSIGGISFRNKATKGVLNSNPLSPGRSLKPGILIFEPGDGGSVYGRNDRIRYDSPNFYGFNLCASHAYQKIGDLFDVALKFAAILKGVTLVVQTSWARNDTQDFVQGFNFQQNATVLGQTDLYKGPKFDTTNGAIGVLLPVSASGKEGTGLNFHVSAARRKWKLENQDDGRAFQGKIGYLDYFFPIGKTAFVVSAGKWKAMDVDFWTNTPAFPGSEGTGRKITLVGRNWGTGIVQTIDSVGTSIYLRYDNYRLKRQHTRDKFRDVNMVYAGVFVKL
jgi:hypothetical protein